LGIFFIICIELEAISKTLDHIVLKE